MTKGTDDNNKQQDGGQQLDSDFEKLKLIYNQIPDNYRYFLSWIRYLLAGYFAVVAALFYAAFTLFDKGIPHDKWTFAITLSIGFTSLLFLLLDKRNRDLYHICQRVGSRIEKELFSDKDLDPYSKDNKGLFFTLDKSHKNSSKLTHSKLIDILCITTMILTFVMTVYLFVSKTLPAICQHYS